MKSYKIFVFLKIVIPYYRNEMGFKVYLEDMVVIIFSYAKLFSLRRIYLL